MWAKSLLFSVAIALLSCSNADYNVAQYCQLVPVGTKFPSLTSCQTYYTCLNNYKVLSTNCNDINIFDKDLQDCVPPTQGNCVLNDVNPCANKTNVWIADTKNCRIWHFCLNSNILASGCCQYQQYFNETAQACKNGKCNTTNENGVVINNVCKIMQNGQFFGDFNDCTAWNKCNGMTLKSGTCQHGLLYDSKKRMCVFSNGNTCARPTKNCSADISDKYIGDTNTCSVYYECIERNSKWMWQKNRCPFLQYYDTKEKCCKHRQIATPEITCDRCEFTKTTWVNEVDPNCSKYLICNNGRKIANGTCSHNSYFNEQQQFCIQGNITEYRPNNGACVST